MKLYRFLFFVIVICPSSFCGIVNSKQKPKLELDVYQRRILFRQEIEEVIKAKKDINANYQISTLNYKKCNISLLSFAVGILDVESVKLLLENGVNTDIEYFEEEYGWDEKLNKPKMVRPTILNYVSSRLHCKLIESHFKKYEEIQKLLVFAGANTSKWNYPDKQLLKEYYSKLKEEFNKIDLLIPELQNIVLEYVA